ncbi:Retrovirus-related Pol polyprotein from transposon TNT 1-94 [Nymphaea thermarum]|nr:Retrovirus-related Pol polyprotein from transposon TNT 1-94 [Nymphaea thermarum]
MKGEEDGKEEGEEQRERLKAHPCDAAASALVAAAVCSTAAVVWSTSVAAACTTTVFFFTARETTRRTMKEEKGKAREKGASRPSGSGPDPDPFFTRKRYTRHVLSTLSDRIRSSRHFEEFCGHATSMAAFQTNPCLDKSPPKYIDCEVKKTVVGDKGEISFEYETLTENNPEYEVWPAHDQSLVAYITSTLSEEVLGGIDDDLTALELWSTLATTYFQVSEAHFLQLRRQFKDIKCGTRTVLEYLNEIKSVSDQLTAIGHPVSDKDKVQQALSGLGTKFDIFCTALEVLHVLPSFEDLKAKLFQHEASHVQRHNLIPSNSHNVLITGKHALQGNHTRPWTSQARMGKGILRTPPGMNTTSATSRRVPTCFYCNKRGHVKSECWHNPQNKNNQVRRENRAATGSASSSSGSNQTSNVSADVQQLLMTALSKLHLKQNEQGEWYVDSGAAVHVTGDTGNLSSVFPYLDQGSVVTGDGSHHTGILPTPPGMNTTSATSRRVPTCFYCNKRGHVKSECWHNPRNKNNQVRHENRAAAGSASSSSGSNQTSNVSADVQQLLMTALSKLNLKQNEQGEWYVDSGAAAHVTGDTGVEMLTEHNEPVVNEPETSVNSSLSSTTSLDSMPSSSQPNEPPIHNRFSGLVYSSLGRSSSEKSREVPALLFITYPLLFIPYPLLFITYPALFITVHARRSCCSLTRRHCSQQHCSLFTPDDRAAASSGALTSADA